MGEVIGQEGDTTSSLSLSGLVQKAKSFIAATTDKVNPNTYTCNTAECGRLGGIVVNLSGHYHPCPDEGDMCDAKICNESGACQA